MFNQEGAFSQQPEEAMPSLPSSPEDVFVPDEVRREIEADAKTAIAKGYERVKELAVDVPSPYDAMGTGFSEFGRAQYEQKVRKAIAEWKKNQYEQNMTRTLDPDIEQIPQESVSNEELRANRGTTTFHEDEKQVGKRGIGKTKTRSAIRDDSGTWHIDAGEGLDKAA